MKSKKRAFTILEMLVALVIITVVALFAVLLYTTSYETERFASDACVLEMAQVDVMEQFQASLDAGEYIPHSLIYETEAGRFTIRTELKTEHWQTSTGKSVYLVEATSRIGGTNRRKITSQYIMTAQVGQLYN